MTAIALFPILSTPRIDGARIKTYRIAAGFTQAVAGSRMGFLKNPASRWSDFETGRIPAPDREILETMAGVLHVEPRQLLSGCLDPLPDAPPLPRARTRKPPKPRVTAPGRMAIRPGVLKCFRETRGLSMQAAARAGGLKGGAQAWGAYEWGKVRKPARRILDQLATALGVTVTDIAAPPEPVEAPPPDSYRAGYEAGYGAGHAEGKREGLAEAERQVAEAIRLMQTPPPAPVGVPVALEPTDNPSAAPNAPETVPQAAPAAPETVPVTLSEALAGLSDTVAEAARVAALYQKPPALNWSEAASAIGGGLDLTG